MWPKAESKPPQAMKKERVLNTMFSSLFKTSEGRVRQTVFKRLQMECLE